MPQANITINGVVGSDTDLPINTLVQLDNQNIGGELSYAWQILDQPPGAADALSSAVLQNPTFTPRKEGSYLISLTVNAGLPTEQQQTVVASVVQLKTLERIPAAGEVLEADTADGWATSMNSLLRRVDALLSDPGIIVGVNASGGVLTRGQVLRCTAASVIKVGLPGQETVPGYSLAHANALAELDELLVVLEGAPDGTASVANGALAKVRYIGRLAQVAIANGPVAVGDTIYINDAGNLDRNQGTIRRRVGSAMSAGATADVWFNGVGGADIDLTPIDRAYLVHGNPGTLPNAIRTDGTNNTASTTGFRFGSGAVGTVALTAKGFAGQVANIFEVLNSADTLLAGFDADGDLVFNAAARRVQWPTWYVFEQASGELRVRWVTAADYVSFTSVAGGGTPGTAMRATNSVAGLFVELKATPTRLELNASDADLVVANAPPGNDCWIFRSYTNGFHLESILGGRIIGIAQPVGETDAANAAYLFESAKLKNYVLNSGFDFWQRGNVVTATHGAAAGVYDRAYAADRWYAAATSTAGASGAQATMTRAALAGGLSNGDYEAQCNGSVGGAGNYTVSFVQEIDRRIVRQLRGKSVNVSAYLRNISLPAGVTWSLALFSGTGAETQTLVGGYTGVTPVASVSDLTDNLTANFARKTARGNVGASVTTLAVVLTWSGAAGGADDGSLGLANVMVAQTGAAGVLMQPWERMHSSYEAEFDACEYFFQKSYHLADAPGTASLISAHTTYFLNVATGVGAPMALGAHIPLHRRMRDAGFGLGVVALYSAGTGAVGNWAFGAGDVAVFGYCDGGSSVRVFNNTGGIYNPGALLYVQGHWTVSCEI